MGEAKKRGTFEERKAMVIAKAEERERVWNEKQRQRREERLKAEAIQPHGRLGRPNTRTLAIAAILAVSMGVVTGR